MEFDASILQRKLDLLDGILHEEALLQAAVREVGRGADGEWTRLRRPWEPGGGSTLFAVLAGGEEWFLKVKRLELHVESKLEGEASFPAVPALRNEYAFLERVKGLGPHTPQRFAYLERGGYGFLFVERLSAFHEVASQFGPVELLEVFLQIEETVRQLFAQDIVHTDVHENNIMFRGRVPVLVDFEEARVLRQGMPFEDSLDVAGENRWGNVGEMPAGHGRLGGLTCLRRLKQVVEKLILSKLEELLRACNFDSGCPFLLTLDHGQDTRIYQSIDIPGVLSVEGQRPVADPRIESLLRHAHRLCPDPFTHLDIGSNLGRFNIELSRSDRVRLSVGVEAYQPYVDLSRILAFLGNAPKAQFLCAECGKDSLSDLLAGQTIDLVTMYSVHHHIANKAAFLADIRRLNPAHVILEMAVQSECYGGRTWQEEVVEICRALEMPDWEILEYSQDYSRPIVLVSRRKSTRGVAAETAEVAQPVVERGAARGAGPQVSIVLPTYNHGHVLPASVASVLAQTYADFELIVVDDASTDDTGAYLAGLTDPRIRIIRHDRNRRLPTALNTGFGVARGELLTWTSADNYCSPVFLEALVAALDAYPDAGLAYSAFAWIDERDRITGVCRDQDFTHASLLSYNPGNASFLYRRNLQEKVGLYDAGLEGAEDWDMWLRMREQCEPVYVPEILYYYRLHAGSMTRTMPDAIRRAAERTFAKALERRGDCFQLDDLYPTLSLCQDRRQAGADACLDLAGKFLQSPWLNQTMGAIAGRSIERAVELGADRARASVLLALGRARCGEWEAAAHLTGDLRRNGNVDVRAAAEALVAACAKRNLDQLAAAVRAFTQSHPSELARLEYSRRRVFAFTARHGETAACGNPMAGPGVPRLAGHSVRHAETSGLAAHPHVDGAGHQVGRDDRTSALERAEAALRTGGWMAACRSYIDVLQSDPRCATARSGLGLALLALGDVEEGLAQLNEAVRLEASPDLVNNLACGLMHVGRLAEAERLLEGIVAVAPTHGDARDNLTRLRGVTQGTGACETATAAFIPGQR